MTAIQNLLAATDLSERSALAERRAAILCAQLKCMTAELLTVKEAEQPETLARLMNDTPEAAEAVIADAALCELHARANELSDNYGVNFTCTVRFGRPAMEIAIRGEEISADLMVVGAHGGNFFTDLFLGNTADKLVRLCKRPLLIVKNEPVRQYRNILVPVDFSDDAKQAANTALQIEPQANITFLHAYDVWFEGKMHYANVAQEAIDYYRMEARESARLALNGFIAGLKVPQRHFARHLVFGIPGPVVRDFAEKMQPDLIVMGKHGRSRIEEMIIGSVTRDTIDQTKCDILIVPSRSV